MWILTYWTITLIIYWAKASPVEYSSGPQEWDILKLTQSWPPAACIYVENEDQKCNISSSIRSWVIHGLWPTKTGTEGPNFCNDTWKFDLSKVEVLRPRLDYNWPAIVSGESPEASWKHEWEKHGTCAASLEALKDELLYFNQTLGLHVTYNISLFLAQHGVLPSNTKTYNAEDIQTALKDTLGVLPSIYCVKEKKTDKFFLEQVEVCLDKTFQLVDCDSGSSSIDAPRDLLFLPENLIQDSQKYSSIHDCGKGGVYYKPMAAVDTVKSGLLQ